MKLADYLSQTGLSQTAFADLIGATSVTVSRYVSGERRPSDEETYQRIYAATGGLVTANDFYGIQNTTSAPPAVAVYEGSDTRA